MDEKMITDLTGYSLTRRDFLARSVVGGALLFTAPGVLAELLELTAEFNIVVGVTPEDKH